MSAPLGRRAFARQVAAITALALLGGCGGSAVSTRQAPKLRRIGWLSGNSSATSQTWIEVVRQTLIELWYVHDRDFVIDVRITEGFNEQLPAMAAELIAQPVDVLVAEAVPAALAAKRATATIPIVFVFPPDPVETGLVASMARPGGNVTGVSSNSTALSGKKLELLKETVPGIARVAVLWRSDNPGQVLALRETQNAGRTLGLEIEAFGVPQGAPGALDTQLDAIARKRFDALVMLVGFGPVECRQVVEFAARSGLLQMYSRLDFAAAEGGLMALAPSYPALMRRTAHFIDKILRGARPADLPVEQPTQFDFTVNLTMAQRLGLPIPDSVLRQATEVLQ